jgi:hypothetical protein
MSESVRVTVDAEPREPGLWRTHRAARRRAGGALPRGPEAAITFPRTLDEASRAVGEFRAGGTDLSKRFRTDVSRGSIVDLRDLGDLDRIQWGTGVACASGRESGSRHWRGAEVVREAYPRSGRRRVGDAADPDHRRVLRRRRGPDPRSPARARTASHQRRIAETGGGGAGGVRADHRTAPGRNGHWSRRWCGAPARRSPSPGSRSVAWRPSRRSGARLDHDRWTPAPGIV